MSLQGIRKEYSLPFAIKDYGVKFDGQPGTIIGGMLSIRIQSNEDPKIVWYVHPLDERLEFLGFQL